MKTPYKILGVILGLVGVFAVAACAYWFTQKPVYILSATTTGQHLEDFVPRDANVVAFFDKSDARLGEYLKKATGQTTDELISSLGDNLIQEGTLPREVVLALVKSKHVVIAGSLPFLNPELMTAFYKNPESVSQDSFAPTATIIFESEKPEEVKTALMNGVRKDVVSFQVVGSVIVVSNDTPEHFNAQHNVPSWKHQTLGYSKQFQSLVPELKGEKFLTLYVDQGAVSSERGAENAETQAALSAAMIMGFSTNTDGIAMETYSDTFPRIAHETLMAVNGAAHESLLKGLPTQGLLMVSESFEIGRVFALQKSIKDMISKTLALDFEKDLAPVLHGSTVFLLTDSGNVLPGLSFFSELNTRDDARSLITKLDELIGNLVTFGNFMLKTDPAAGPFIERTPVVAQGISAATVTAHPERASSEVQVQATILALVNNLRITYGTVTQNNKPMFFVSTNPTVIQDLRNSALHGRGTEPLNIYVATHHLTGQRLYVDIDGLGIFISRAFGRFAQALPKEEQGQLVSMGNLVERALAPFDAIFTLSGANKEHLVSQGILQFKK